MQENNRESYNLLEKAFQTVDRSSYETINILSKMLRKCTNKHSLECANAYNLLGISYWKINRYDKSLKYFFKALNLSNNFYNDLLRIKILNNIGIIYRDNKEYNKALDYFLKAIKESETIGNNRYYIYIGNISKTLLQDNFKIEVKDYKVSEELKNFNYTVNVLKNKQKENIQKALNLALRELELFNQNPVRESRKAKILLNLSKIYNKLNERTKCIDIIKRGLKIAKENDYFMILLDYYDFFVNFYFKSNELAKVKKYVDLGIKISNKENHLSYLSKFYYYYSIYYEKIGDIDNAYKYLKKHDDVFKKISEKRVIENLMKIKKNNEIKNLENEIEKNNNLLRKIQGENTVLDNILTEKTNKIYKMEKYYEIGKFSASIVHNLKSPLTSINGLIDLLKIKNKKGILTENLLDKYLTKLDKINDDMIEMAKSITLKAQSFDSEESQKININTAIKRTIDMKKYDKTFNPSVEIKFDLEKNLPLIEGKKIHFKQIFSNLINNSIHAIENSSKKKINITTKSNKNSIIVIVEDTGIGIKKSDLKYVFSSDFTTKNPGKGTGLGLSITKQMVESYKGTIDVVSKWNKGTKFTLKFPNN